MKKIALLGHGRIGKAIEHLLTNTAYDYTVIAYDHPRSIKSSHDRFRPVIGLDLEACSPGELQHILDPFDAVIVATPHTFNLKIAEQATRSGIAYFDLTEDVNVTRAVKALPCTNWVVPQCGLAPGAVSIIARDLVRGFDSILDVNLRVGALPVNTNNRMKYYLTWSSDGLINEYCNPCDAVVNHRQVKLEPLDSLETVVIDGIEYEAFNTSGGVGSLIDTLAPLNPRNVNYKTVRYRGHRQLMDFMLNELELRTRQDLLVEIFDRVIPHAGDADDVVVIFIQAIGKVDGRVVVRTYSKKIYGDDTLSAIQKTTAAGACAIVHEWAIAGKLPPKQHPRAIVPEDFTLQQMNLNPFWTAVY